MSTLSPGAAYRVLARAGYGAAPGEAEALAREGLSAWLDRQLAPPAEDRAIDASLDRLALPIRYPAGPGEQITDEMRPLRTLAAGQAENFGFRSRPGLRVPGPERERFRLELSAATLLRKAAAEAVVRERMVEFWHDHFSVSAQASDRVAVSLPEHDRRIRAHALGDFRALLEAMATSPAMLVYLNNSSSRAGAPNENYARELLELHTLGRPAYLGAARSGRGVPALPDGTAAGYVDADVWEAARAFTGWSIAGGQRLDTVRGLPENGDFVFVGAWHDHYQKRFLGRDLDPFPPAMAHGRAVLDILSAHPATARFVAAKLTRFFIGDDAPEAAVARAAAAFRTHGGAPDQIARTVRALLAGPEIADSAFGRVRRPLDLIAAAARAFAIPLAPGLGLIGQMGPAGQPLFSWPSPDGQPLDAEGYLGAGALRARWQMLHSLARDSNRGGLSPRFAELAGSPVEAVTERLARDAIGPGWRPVADSVAEVWGAAGRTPKPHAAGVAELAAWVLCAPAFQTT